MGRKKKRNRDCVYCGKHGKVTEDHVPPKSLFAKDDRRDLVKVPACTQCNVEASKDDEYFRTVLVLRDDVYDHPDVKAIIPVVMRSLQRPEKTGFKVSFLKGFRKVYPRTASGLLLPSRGVYTVEGARLERVMQRVTKGLFYHHNGYRLPDDYEEGALSPTTLASMSPGDYQDLKSTMLDPLAAEPTRTMGRSVFAYKFRSTDDDPNATMWLYLFYKRIPFVGVTLRRGEVRL